MREPNLKDLALFMLGVGVLSLANIDIEEKRKEAREAYLSNVEQIWCHDCDHENCNRCTPQPSGWR